MCMHVYIYVVMYLKQPEAHVGNNWAILYMKLCSSQNKYLSSYFYYNTSALSSTAAFMILITLTVLVTFFWRSFAPSFSLSESFIFNRCEIILCAALIFIILFGTARWNIRREHRLLSQERPVNPERCCWPVSQRVIRVLLGFLCVEGDDDLLLELLEHLRNTDSWHKVEEECGILKFYLNDESSYHCRAIGFLIIPLSWCTLIT